MVTTDWERLPLDAVRAAWDASPTLLVVTVGPDHILVFQNAASAQLFGPRPIGRPMAEAFPELSAGGKAALDRVLATGSTLVEPRNISTLHGAGTDEVQLTYAFAPLGSPGDPPVGVVMSAVDVTSEARAARAAEQIALLGEISERMNAASDPGAALQHLTDTLVPAVADLAAVVVLPETDQPTNLAPARDRAVRPGPPAPPTALTLNPDLVRRVGPPPGNTRDSGPSPWEASLATGNPLIIDIARGELAGNSDDATNAWLVRAEAHNMAVLPLALAGRLAGAVVLMSFGDRAPYVDADLPFLEQVAARAGTAVSHVRAFGQSRDIALDLQHALLPQAPGQLPGVEVAVRYVAGGPDVEVGGDWWDVHPLGAGRIGIGLGDVAGTGVQAAVVMGQARSAMRAAALAELTPSAVLALLDEQLGGIFEAAGGEDSSSPRFATALYAVLDVGSAVLSVANAGHPPLLVRDVDGTTRWVHARPGPPLGLRLPTYEEIAVPFPAGSLCLGFTDGLVESRRQGVQEGLDRLADFVRRLPGDLDVEAVADAVLEEMAHGDRHDDTALVVLRSTRCDSTDRRSRLMAAGSKDDPWQLTTPPGSSAYTMYRDDDADPPALVCQVGSTTLRYHLRAIEDLHAWLLEQPGWVPLGAADEKKPAAEGTVEAWGRSSDNPVGGWYGLRAGYRGRFGMYLPPLLEQLGLAEVTHDARNNSMRAIPSGTER